MKVGQVVKLKPDERQMLNISEGRHDHQTAQIISIGAEGEITLNRDLGGIRYWNIDDVVESKSPKQINCEYCTKFWL